MEPVFDEFMTHIYAEDPSKAHHAITNVLHDVNWICDPAAAGVACVVSYAAAAAAVIVGGTATSTVVAPFAVFLKTMH